MAEKGLTPLMLVVSHHDCLSAYNLCIEIRPSKVRPNKMMYDG